MGNESKYSNPGGTIALSMAVDTAALPENTVVEYTGDYQVDKAAAGSAKVAGSLVVPAKTAGGMGTVETGYARVDTVQAAETLAAGDYVKVGADDGDGNQQFAKWVSASDAASLKLGQVVSGGDSGDDIDVGFYR